ncbi:hypothetical protein BV20DRAFT_61985 [Pilatotrama ljubarskyi]|nr:hypothetical protein BV20DRAFT_61985 [Pilatotrama ljubarskyi]
MNIVSLPGSKTVGSLRGSSCTCPVTSSQIRKLRSLDVECTPSTALLRSSRAHAQPLVHSLVRQHAPARSQGQQISAVTSSFPWLPSSLCLYPARTCPQRCVATTGSMGVIRTAFLPPLISSSTTRESEPLDHRAVAYLPGPAIWVFFISRFCPPRDRRGMDAPGHTYRQGVVASPGGRAAPKVALASCFLPALTTPLKRAYLPASDRFSVSTIKTSACSTAPLDYSSLLADLILVTSYQTI